jgi:hypothetical protein
MASKDEIIAVALFAFLVLIIVLTIERGTVDTDAVARLKRAKAVVVVRQGDVYALLAHMRIANSSTGVCNTIYATSSPSSNETDVIVVVCGKYAYVYYLR